MSKLHGGYTEFIHGAPGAVDCWDAVVICATCRTKYVSAGGIPIKYNAYLNKVAKYEVRRGWPFKPEDELEDCDMIVVRQVLET